MDSLLYEIIGDPLKTGQIRGNSWTLSTDFVMSQVMSTTSFSCHGKKSQPKCNKSQRVCSHLWQCWNTELFKMESWCRFVSKEFASSSLHIVIAQPQNKIEFAVFTIITQLDVIRLIIRTSGENIYIFTNLYNLGTWSRIPSWVQPTSSTWSLQLRTELLLFGSNPEHNHLGNVVPTALDQALL